MVAGAVTPVVDVVVPVLHRPQRAAPFMASLTATVGARARVWPVVSTRDRRTLRAWDRAGAAVIAFPGYPGTFAQKANHAYRALAGHDPTPWLLLSGDDVEFHPGWLDAALTVAEATGAAVIGTNDLGERDDGEQAVHPFIRRAYVDERGASWDGPGVLCHEGYRHNYVDAELAHVARQRGVWAPAPLAVIEHVHHLFGRAAVDATYELGAQHLAADAAHYAGRVRRHVG